MPTDPKRVQDIFVEVVNLPEDDRAAAVREACGDDAELKKLVENLLVAFDAPDSIFDSTGGWASDTDSQKSGSVLFPPIDVGLQINERYSLQEKIGEGGMGEVWVAQQSSPVSREVAIKLVKTGLDSKTVLARFEQERQALALMEHPNIASVFDGGVTPIGQPFFAMELVKGLPLTKYCDEQKLSPRERLELFVPICNAIQHAHQKGIVHRDLKPANILVAIVDGKPVPKVIDFGVSKATQGKLTDKTLATSFGVVVGTLEYMAPEQAGTNAADVDTRADIYSLGVILYEILTGLRPFSSARLEKAALGEMVRIIQEEEPSKPSTRLSSSESLPSLAALRRTDPSRLTSILKGELDWIILKCLEKSRDRRYETASSLAREIQRYLNDEPVEARPPSNRYRLGKFLRRNKVPVAATGLLGAALIAGIAGTSYGLLRANESAAKERTAKGDAVREAEKARTAESKARDRAAEAERERLAAVKSEKESVDVLEVVIDAFGSADPRRGSTYEMTAKEVLFEAKSKLETSELEDGAKAKILDALVEAFIGVGDLKAANKTAEDFAALQQKVYSPDHVETLMARSVVARTLIELGDFKEASELLEQLQEEYRNNSDISDERQIRLEANLAIAYAQSGRFDESNKLFEAALKWHMENQGEEHPDTLHAVQNLASGLGKVGRAKEAFELTERALASSTKSLGSDHPDTLDCMQNLALVYDEMGDLEAALGLRESCLERSLKKLGEDHPTTIKAMRSLAKCYDNFGRYGESLDLKRNVIPSLRETFGREHPETLEAMNSLAAALSNNGIDLDKAVEMFHLVLEKYMVLGEERPATQRVIGNLWITLKKCKSQATAQLTSQQFDEAETLLVAMKKYHGPHVELISDIDFLLGAAHIGQKQFGKARESIVQWQNDVMNRDGEAAGLVATAKALQAVCLCEIKRYDDANGLAAIALKDDDLISLFRHQSLAVQIECLIRQSKQDDADPKLKQLLAQLDDAIDQSPPHWMWMYSRMMDRLIVSCNSEGLADQAKLLKEAKVGVDQKVSMAWANTNWAEAEFNRLNESLGAAHPNVEDARRDLIGRLESVGEIEKLVKFIEDAVADLKREVGNEHPLTLFQMNSLASTLSNYGLRLDRALELFDEVVQLRTKTLGQEHSQTEMSNSNLLVTLDNARAAAVGSLAGGKFEEAATVFKAMLDHHGVHATKVDGVAELFQLSLIGQKKWKEALEACASDQSTESNASAVTKSVALLELGRLVEAKAVAEKTLRSRRLSELDRYRVQSVLNVCNSEATDVDFEFIDSSLGSLPYHLTWLIPRSLERNSRVSKDERWTEKLKEVETFLAERIANAIPLAQASAINSETWEKVVANPATDEQPLTPNELTMMRRVGDQYPTGMNQNTLGVAEYRMGNFEEAIQAATISLEKMPEEMGLESEHPSDLAILAMSHFRLGNKEKARQFYQRLGEAMKKASFKSDAESKGFANEALELFASGEIE